MFTIIHTEKKQQQKKPCIYKDTEIEKKQLRLSGNFSYADTIMSTIN